MKKLIQKSIISVITTTMTLFGFVSNVFAVDPLNVVFNPNPLFVQANFLPLDETSGVVTITNNSDATQDVLTEAINVLDDDNFGSLLHLNIVGDSGTLFNNSLYNFFSTAGEVPLGAISSGESKIFTYTISFIDSSNNSYQGKTLGFDVCVGFSGGTSHCGNTVVGSENDTDGGGGTGNPPPSGTITGSGGGGSVLIPLTISNEQTSALLPLTTATIVWDTNKLATSQVIYGLTSGGPYTLDLNAVNFGYPFSNTEDPVKVLHHSMLITGLIPGQIYDYRVVSRASPPTVSFEHQFTIPLLALGGPNNSTNLSDLNSGGGAGAGGGSSDVSSLGLFSPPDFAVEGTGWREQTSESALLTDENNGNDTDSGNNLAANILLSGFENILSTCSLIALLILLVIYIIWRLWLRKKHERNLVSEEEILNRFYLFFGGSSLLMIFISIIWREYCLLPVLITSFVISLCLYVFRKLKM